MYVLIFERITNYDSLAAKHVTAKNYQVDSYFGPEDDTEYIYNYTASNLIPNLVDGFNCSVFCYGKLKQFQNIDGDLH